MYGPSRAVGPPYGREPTPMQRGPPRRRKERSSAQATEPSVIGQRTPQPKRAPKRPKLKPTAVRSKERKVLQGLSLLTRSPGITRATSGIHAAAPKAALRPPLTTLTRRGGICLTNIASSAIARRRQCVFLETALAIRPCASVTMAS